MKPSLGRIVHWIGFNGVERAAVISRVNDDGSVDLSVFVSPKEIGPAMACDVAYDELQSANTWHWPERV